MILIVRMAPAAPGLREIPSAGAEVARPCPMAPAAAAIPSRNAAPIAPHLTPEAGAAPPAGSWAMAGNARQSRARAKTKTFFLGIQVLLILNFSVFLVGRSETDVHRRQSH